MTSYITNSPVLLILFNRPDEAMQLLKVITDVKPKQLFISIDGPRDENDLKSIEKVLKYISTEITYDCELKIQRLKENLGCGLGPRAGITWFFENVEQGIILEDDCIPSKSFFKYCDDLLEKYEHNKKTT